MNPTCGLDVLAAENCSRLKGQRIGLVCHQASVTSTLEHAIDLLSRCEVDLRAVFGPQHGVWGQTQDNMIEWEGYRDQRTGIPFYSLYGETRIPKQKWLQELDLLIFDVQDVGTRVYTFIWTLAHCMEACGKAGLPLLVLDRPNPIGSTIEGPMLDAAFSSFVGLHPLPMRHGMTIGEVARWLNSRFYPSCSLSVLSPTEMPTDDQNKRFWVPPSPNMPYLETAYVYPGQVLLEGTNINEGRGTTRPFAMFGAPWLDSWKLADAFSALNLPGVFLRPITYIPTFQKHAGQLCGGGFIHVIDREAFRPVLTSVVLLQLMWQLSEGKMRWIDPPYEYETEKMPIDILSGSTTLRQCIEEGWNLNETLQFLELNES